MRLFELINTTPVLSTRDNFDRIDKTQSIPGAERSGSGAFGITTYINSPKRLNQVTKISYGRHQQRPDGYEIYIEKTLELKEKGIDNPYFPRVMGYKKFNNNDNNSATFSNLQY
jgi:hypothetical protein